MGKIIFVALVCLFSTATLAQPINQVDSKNRKQGKWQKNYPDSKAFEYVGQFKDDKPVGTFYYYYPSTKPKAIIVHDPKGNRSAATMFHENGVVSATGIYRSQKKDSVWCFFGPSGRLSTKETYKNDTLNGKKIIYYVPEDPADKSQKVAVIETYLNGKRHGEYLEYFDFGPVVKAQGMYENGRKVGKFTTFHPNGKPMIIERYKYGGLHGWCFGYDENGKETGKRYYRFGRELIGEELEKWIEECKKTGKSPND